MSVSDSTKGDGSMAMKVELHHQDTTGSMAGSAKARGGFTRGALRVQGRDFSGTNGTSRGVRSLGLEPGFFDPATDKVYRARFADGSPAPMHVLDGLPRELVARRDQFGRVQSARARLVVGFLLDGRFLTREEATELAATTDEADRED